MTGILFLISWLCTIQVSQSQLEVYINFGLSNNLTLNSRQDVHKTPVVEVNTATVTDFLFSFPVHHAAGKLQNTKEIKPSLKR
ncbi:MAG: hypothetical protein ACOC0C_04850 [Bacteroidota bacterium]